MCTIIWTFKRKLIMDKNELRYHLQKCEKLNQRRKLKRFCYTVLFYAAVFLAFAICKAGWKAQPFLTLSESLLFVSYCL